MIDVTDKIIHQRYLEAECLECIPILISTD